MNNFTLRTITGIIFVTVIVLAVWFSYVSMLLLFLLIVALGLWEFFSLVERIGYKPLKIPAIIVAVLIFSSLFSLVEYSFPKPPSFLFVLPGFFLIIELYRKNEHPFLNVAYTLFGLVYILLPFYLLAWHAIYFYRSYDPDLSRYYPYLILGVFFLIWSNDTFAYLFGKAIGKTKLFERISPKKTWEGTIGGGIGTIAIAILLSRFFGEYSLNDWLIVAIIVVVIGTLGDLVESLFKRSINIKDSGNIIPGHGGILDRFDSFFLAAPVVFFYVNFCRDFF